MWAHFDGQVRRAGQYYRLSEGTVVLHGDCVSGDARLGLAVRGRTGDGVIWVVAESTGDNQCGKLGEAAAELLSLTFAQRIDRAARAVLARPNRGSRDDAIRKYWSQRLLPESAVDLNPKACG